jgi:hypothetical protein
MNMRTSKISSTDGDFKKELQTAENLAMFGTGP